ncbi:MAG TPA: amino acid ABC transporter permease [Candidatus Cryosericum sp.]|jgi:polar amino acid transport system permease protein|nr:amino acid ABC transporter permease [Candidatus Cryosericum sp.]
MAIDFRLIWEKLPFLLGGAWTTFSLTCVSMVFATVAGLIVGLLNMFGGKVLGTITRVYIEAVRGTPALLLILIVYYALPRIGLNFPQFPAAAVSLAVCYAAYIAEVFRSAVESIPMGQTEAAYSLGMSRTQSLRYIILPQTFRRVLPPLANEFAALIKDTSLVAFISMEDLLFRSKMVSAATYDYFSPLVGAALIYLVMTLPIMQWSRSLEKKVD